MSFSQNIKDEIEKQQGQARHCRIAELAVILYCYGQEETLDDGSKSLVVVTEHEAIVRKYFTLLKKTFNIKKGLFEGGAPCARTNAVWEGRILEEENYREMLEAVKMWDYEHSCFNKESRISSVLLKTTCCKRAFLRGCYACMGSMSDPEKGYHLEFVCNREEMALQIQDVLAGFDLEGKITLRRKYHVVYIKEGESIGEVLNIIEAHKGLMDFETTRVIKDVKNRVNRRSNFEAANLLKSVDKGNMQVADILFIQETKGLDFLPRNLQEVALLRLEHPHESYQELGAYLDPPIGKSGVNHRLRKIGEIAEKLRM